MHSDGSYLTHKGTALIAKLLASRGELRFTRATVGSGTVPEGMTPEEMTGLNHHDMDGMIVAIDNPNNGEAAVVVQAFSEGFPYGFFATEVALWAIDPDEGEILYTYLSIAEHPEWIRPWGDSVLKLATFTLITIVSGVPLVSAVIDPRAFVRMIDLAKYALIGHRHSMDDIDGLWDYLNGLSGNIALLFDLVGSDSGGGGTVFYADFVHLSNIIINDGIYNSAERRIEAGA